MTNMGGEDVHLVNDHQIWSYLVKSFGLQYDLKGSGVQFMECKLKNLGHVCGHKIDHGGQWWS